VGLRLPTTLKNRPLRKSKKAQSARRSGGARGADPANDPRGKREGFLIVGIGASAGGLDALGQFFKNVPVDSGMAFVVVQHLDPTQKGMMPELLQRVTAMKVCEATDRILVRPNSVYIIPPNCDLSLFHGVLHLLPPAQRRGLRLPIDFFFRSLAEDRRARCAGVVLSGMGNDGTLGIRAIKEKGGTVLVQDPATAEFDSMPRGAIETGLPDFVGSIEDLPARLIAYGKVVGRRHQPEPVLEGKSQGSLEKVLLLLRTHTGHDFTHYRRSTLYRRVERRLVVHKLTKLAAYVRFLQANPQELGILFKEMMIGVTNFFRDPLAWQQLAKLALPGLLASRPAGGVIRAWVAGCSTGEEAYTLAILLSEMLKETNPAQRLSVQIYATDLDKDAVEKARQGFFPLEISADVSPARLSRFFTKEPGGYRIKKEIRSMIVFAPHNLIMDPPFTTLDILTCRNLLIYLTPALQRKLFPLFRYALNPSGILFLGSAESIAGTDLFTPLAPKARIFRRSESNQLVYQLDLPEVFSPLTSGGGPGAPPATRTPPSLQLRADQLLQSRYAPPAVIVNDKGDILYISGRTGRYLEPAAGKANWNVLAMAREELRYDLATALQKVVRKQGTITVAGLSIGDGAEARSVDLAVQKLEEPKELRGLVLIIFSEPAAPPLGVAKGSKGGSATRNVRQRDLEEQLRRAREEIQAGREEMQTSQEELKSMNEELQSTNEELQSSNEELTTSKEEMQSLNEELQTVNSELQTKLDELSGANNDMKNLLNSTEIATVFLDNDLCVRRFTLQAKTFIKFIPSDVGRPITDLASDLLYPELVADAQQVLSTLVFSERSITTNDGRWFTVRIMPYRTMDNRIDGVVITFADISAAKAVEAELRAEQSALAKHSLHQGISLDRAMKRLMARDPEGAVPPAKAGPGEKSAGKAGKPKS
jgi:two-component system CheB/CheR fusion protein